MCFFENDYFLNILKTYKDSVFDIIVPEIFDFKKIYYFSVLKDSINALITILKGIDLEYYNKAKK